ncbi:MAG: GNAT family N-acetyltransferase [Alphaproteobacteria bacterium]|nr:GNAT family N-acetyltransferase [Alphaproteobacteria bacterium]
MNIENIVDNFIVPPHPKNIILNGVNVRLEPLKTKRHANDLFEANAIDEEGLNWVYLPYGPFSTVESFAKWLETQEVNDDPTFFAIIRKSDEKAVGVASYLRINPNEGSIEVGHINYSPLLQRTKEGTEAMYLMMKWVFENGYRRYEWKCNALNLKSRNAAQRLGFSYEGVFRQAAINKGKNRDTAWFAAIDKEWKALSECFTKYLSKDNFADDGRPKTSLSSLTKPILYKEDNMDFS